MSNFSALKFELRLANKIEIVEESLRTTLDTLQPLPNLVVPARYTVKTVPDKFLNLRNENSRSKSTPQTLLRNNHTTISLQIITKTKPEFDA